MNIKPLRFLVLFGLIGLVPADGVAAHLKPAASPVFESPQGAEFKFGGFVGERILVNVQNWLLIAPSSNPAMLQIFHDRDRTPRRDLVPWAGEFAGKYLISGVQAMRMTQVQGLRRHLSGFVSDLIATQGSDGYLGPFSRDQRMTGKGLWDLWGQYHCMYDPRFDVHDPTSVPELDVTGIPVVLAEPQFTPQPILLLQFAAKNGQRITLCDFASAGMAGNRYVSWLPARGLKPVSFSRENPPRAFWPGGKGR